MTDRLPFDRIGKPASDPTDAYLPFLSAVERGLRNPEDLAVEPTTPIGHDIAKGHIPNPQKAGVVAVGGELLAIDLVGIERWGQQAVFYPIPKTAVDRKGRIVQEGAVIVSNTEGRVRVIGHTIDLRENPWRAERLKRQGRVSPFPHKRNSLAMHILGLDALDFEAQTVSDTGHQIAIPRRRYL